MLWETLHQGGIIPFRGRGAPLTCNSTVAIRNAAGKRVSLQAFSFIDVMELTVPYASPCFGSSGIPPLSVDHSLQANKSDVLVIQAPDTSR